MNYLIYLKKLKAFLVRLLCYKHDHKPKISLLIPFSSKDPIRKKHFKWLLKYWKHELPDAEIIIGHSKSEIFCKGEALNDAVRKSTGKVLVVLDADAYISGKVIERCANRIFEDINNHLWYVPYRRLYRLNKYITEKIINSNPRHPYRLPLPINPDYIENKGHSEKYGNRYGAMLIILPREAYNTIGRFDERFKGWGGEDIALLRTLDTLYGKHKTVNTDIFHLWHPMLGDTLVSRRWEGQDKGSINAKLTRKYYNATRNPSEMKKLISEY